MSSRYTPLPVPTKPEDIPAYLQEELKRISIATNNAADGNFEVNHIEPTKPREGDVRYADGTDWNPGTGAGVYVYTGSAWSKL
jgi:hypothetical protein